MARLKSSKRSRIQTLCTFDMSWSPISTFSSSWKKYQAASYFNTSSKEEASMNRKRYHVTFTMQSETNAIVEILILSTDFIIKGTNNPLL